MENVESVASAARIEVIPVVVTIPEGATILRISEVKMYELLRSGRVKSIIIDGARRPTGKSLLEFIEANEQSVYAPTKQSPRRRQANEEAAA